jgi:uncharacterized protein YeaO (DUF488 family)
MIKTKRIYEPTASDDGFRILVDRLWPRGLSKENAKIDLWLKGIAPSNDLRKWFHHNREKWKEFQIKYQKELEVNKEFVNKIKQIEKEKRIVTLLYSSTDKEHNNAIVLSALLKKL